mgnify:CR=1 FL=1
MPNIRTSNPIIINLNPSKTFKLLLYIIIGLTLANILVRLSEVFWENIPTILVHLFNTDKEQNIPSVFSSIILLFCSTMLYIIFRVKKDNRQHFKDWKILSIIFLVMSIDELLSLHESLNAINKVMNNSGFLYLGWVIPAAGFVLIFILYFMGFIRTLPKKTRRLFIIAGTIYVTGALFLELFAGYLVDPATPNPNYFGPYPYLIQSSVEEFLEMIGIAIFSYALMSYITSYFKETNWIFRITLGENNIVSTSPPKK